MQKITLGLDIASLLSDVHRADQLHKSFNGDLRQMAAQESFLRTRGFDIGRNGGIPGFRSADDLQRGLRLIWEVKCEGWWNYQCELIELSICTADEYKAALRAT